MENTLYILALGFWLAVADWAAIDTRKSFGRTAGLTVWLIAVLAPLVGVAVFMSWKVSLGAAVLATLLSGLAFWCKRQEQLGARASKLYRML